MASASLFLPFLPLLAKQILLNNSLSDLPMLAISTDRVDEDALKGPGRWDFKALLRSMLAFGLLSSIFDGLTFALLLLVFHANEATFQTGWFLVSLLTELAIIAVMRTRKWFFQSLPSLPVVLSSGAVAVVALLIPHLPLAPALGFVPLSASTLVLLLAIVALYIGASEAVKRWFQRRQSLDPGQ
jgi:Mg2+-importing ATPase